MKLKFNRMERIAGTFILVAIVGTLVGAGAILVRKGFFDEKVSFYTVIPSSDSIYPGTIVQMAGIHVGAVENVELDMGGTAKVTFSVKKKYFDRVHEDSKVSLSRASLIGERILDLSTGTRHSGPATIGQEIETQASKDAMGVLTGPRVAQIMENVDHLIVEISVVLQQVAHGKNLEKILGNLRLTTDAFAPNAPKMSQDLVAATTQLAALTTELAKTSPNGTSRIAALLEESNLLIRAIQRNYFLRGHVADIKEEETQRKPASAPASASPSKPVK